jgi:hypothetical protein
MHDDGAPETTAGGVMSAAESGLQAGAPISRHASPDAGGGPRQRRAIGSVVLGIIALLATFLVSPLIGWILAGFAITFGVSARSEARREGQGGDGQATAGIVLGLVSILVGLIALAIALL